MASQGKAKSERCTTPRGEGYTDHRAFLAYCRGTEGEFLERPAGRSATSCQEAFRAAERAATRPLHSECAAWRVGGAEGSPASGLWRAPRWHPRQLLAFLPAAGKNQSAWEGLLGDLYRRGLEGKNLPLIITDSRTGLAAEIPPVYPRVLHRCCWVTRCGKCWEMCGKATMTT